MMADTIKHKITDMKKRSKPIGCKTRRSIHSAVASGRFNTVKVLLSRGFLVNNTDILDHTLLHIAILKGDKQMVQLLLNYNAKIGCQDFKGQTPLHLAAAKGDLEIIKLLLAAPQFERNSTLINIRNCKEETPLHSAANYGYINIIKLLIKHGASVDVKIHDYVTPLHMTVFSSKPKCVKELLNLKFSEYKQHKCAEIIDLLLNAGAKFHDNDLLANALHFAVRLNGYFVVKKLLERGIKVNSTDKGGKTALHMACKFSSANIIRILLKFGADATKKCEEGVLPIHYMACAKNYKILSTLLNTETDINDKTSSGDTLFDYILNYKPKDVSFLYTILRYGVDIHVKSQHNQTALHWMSDFYGYNCAGILFDWFLDFNVVNEYNETPLTYTTTGTLPVASIEFIIKAMAKMEKDNKFKISELNMSIISENYLDLYENCKRELENLKKQKIWEKITFYELLNTPLEKLKGYTRNLELMQVFISGACDSFPLYGGLMNSRMLFAMRLNGIHEKSVDILHQLVYPIKLPSGIVHDILSFLSLEDMEKLSEM